MRALISRPASGSLRTTRVTAATIALAGAVASAALVASVMLLLRVLGAGSPGLLGLEVPLLAIAIAGLDLAVFGIRQRTLRG